MNLTNLKSFLQSKGCRTLYVKKLSPNDNSKNQVYFGGSFEVLNILPIREIKIDESGDWNKERFKASLLFSWIDDDFNISPAPNSQLIMYPKYPEVRFSGFLSGCKNAPSELMATRLPGRLLFISVTENSEVLGYVTSPDSGLAAEFHKTIEQNDKILFTRIDVASDSDNKTMLLNELYRIHNLGWIKSKRLDGLGNILPCEAPNCGGYTLEAELGITPNGYSEPDYLGWEIKQYSVSNLQNPGSAVITLMTPEPTSGIYIEKGTEYFIRHYGYADTKGRPDRMNFGGIHKAGAVHSRTALMLQLIGYDSEAGKIRNANGRIALVDKNGIEAASWDFSSLLLHWNRKHNQACYIPSIADQTPFRRYAYSDNIILGCGTDFQRFLHEFSCGNVYYDPGIKMEDASSKPKIKKRSQFRINSRNLNNLYASCRIVNIKEELRL